jgi:CubicO group peptidase (beta-lactamase class C family)
MVTNDPNSAGCKRHDGRTAIAVDHLQALFRIMLQRWLGYDNAWVVIGQPMQSVTGGGHWGGGMFINAYDMARFGYLTLRRGKWGDRQLLSETWVTMALTPTGLSSPYGFMNYFLNTERKQWPSAPATSFMHNGNGLNMIYIDPENDLDRQQRPRRLSQAADRGGGGEELGRSRQGGK